MASRVRERRPDVIVFTLTNTLYPWEFIARSHL
jgi:hypothetical protein